MSEHDKTDSISRRRALDAAGAIIPLHIGSRVAAAIAPLGVSPSPYSPTRVRIGDARHRALS